MTNTRRWFALALALLILPALAGPAAAGTDGAAFGNYKQGFMDYWQGTFQKQNGVVMGVVGVGVVALFIITRGKWRK